MFSQERWSRNTGTGIGISSHLNEFYENRYGGVLIGNFVEERALLEPSTSSPAPLTSTYRTHICPTDGKVGSELVANAERRDNGSDLKWDILSRHGDFRAARAADCASMYQLSHSLRGRDAHRVQKYTWQGFKQNDLQVPRHIDTLHCTQHTEQGTLGGSLTRASLTAHAHHVRSGSAQPLRPTPINHLTTTTATLLSSALQATQAPGDTLRRGSLRPPSELRGRKPSGPHADELDKTYQRTGLRSYYKT